MIFMMFYIYSSDILQSDDQELNNTLTWLTISDPGNNELLLADASYAGKSFILTISVA